MSGRLIADPAEWERITGLPRVRWTIELPPARPKPPKESEKQPEQDKDD